MLQVPRSSVTRGAHRLLFTALATFVASACDPGAASSQAASQSINEDRTTAIVRATARVAPAVVSVNVLRTQRVRPRTMWESMILPPGAQQRSAGFGSGVIVTERRHRLHQRSRHRGRGASQIRGHPPGRARPRRRDSSAPIRSGRHRGAPHQSGTGSSRRPSREPCRWPHDRRVGAGHRQPPRQLRRRHRKPTVTAGVISAVDRNIAPSADGDGILPRHDPDRRRHQPRVTPAAPSSTPPARSSGSTRRLSPVSGGSEGLGFAIPYRPGPPASRTTSW